MKKHKSILITASFVLLLTTGFCLGTVYMQYRTETKVQAAKSAGNQTQTVQTSDSKTSDIVVESGGEEVSRKLAQQLLEEKPDMPLLYDETAMEQTDGSSLELMINDINANTTETGAREVILQICKEAGIDANTAKVKDLTEEQIMQIDMTVYKLSNHPKN